MPAIPYIGVILPFLRSLSLVRYHFDFLMSLNETLTFLSLSNPALEYSTDSYIQTCHIIHIIHRDAASYTHADMPHRQQNDHQINGRERAHAKDTA